MPDDPLVAYSGKGLADVLTIFICIEVIATKLKLQLHTERVICYEEAVKLSAAIQWHMP